MTFPLSPEKLVAGLAELRADRTLCDVELVAENETFPAHRVVLAAASEYFKAMFGREFRESKMKNIQLKDVSEEGLRRVLDAIYNSEVVITEDNVVPVLSAANMLRMDDIVKSCEIFLKENVTEDNVFTFLEAAEKYDLEHVVNTLNGFILDNFEPVSTTPGYKSLSKEKLCSYISDDRLEAGEIEVFRAAVRWIEKNYGNDKSEKTRREPESILTHVRFPHIHVNALIDEVLSHPLIDGSKASKSLVLEALRYHGDPPKQLTFTGEQYKPRDGRKIIIIPAGTRSKRWAVKESETKLYSFNLLKDTLLEDDAKACPHSFVFSSLSIVATNTDLFLFATGNKSFKPVALLFNSVTTEWTKLKAPPGPGTVGARAIKVKDKIYLTGGMRVTKDSPFKLLGESVEDVVLQYTINSNSWNEVSKMPRGLVYHGAVANGSFIYVMGGSDAKEITSCQTYAYDAADDSWLTKASMNHARCDFCLEAVGGSLYACGGRLSSNSRAEPSVEMYNTFNDQWTVLQNVSFDHCSFSGSFVFNNKIYLVGGYKLDADGRWVVSDSVSCVDVSTKTIAHVSNFSVKCSGHVCAVMTFPRA